MSNIEPTEEQKAAANAFVLKTRIAEEDSVASRGLARLLAEREAKLREENSALQWAMSRAEKAYTDTVDTLRADLSRANGYLLAGQKSEMAMKGQLLDARERVAELEKTCGERLAKLGEAYEEAETGWLGDIAELEEREAQHLADIKALRVHIVSTESGDHDHFDESVDFDGCPACESARILAATAHYDDAKADAPASTEGNRCRLCGPCCARALSRSRRRAHGRRWGMSLIAYIKLLDRYTNNELDLVDEMDAAWKLMTEEERSAANLVAAMIAKAGEG